MDFFGFLLTTCCLLFVSLLLIGLFFAFRANDLFSAKMKEYQDMSKQMFQQNNKKKKSVKSKPKAEPKKENFEDAEFRDAD